MTRHHRLEAQRSPTVFHEPPPTGYLHLAARIGGTIGPTPLSRRTAGTRQLTSRVKALAADLARHPEVTKATVYRAVLLPPPGRSARQLASTTANYDVAVLVETNDVHAGAAVRASAGYQALRATLQEASKGDLLDMFARCLRLIADVDKDRQGLFLFNYFVGRDPEVALPVWEAMASWYAAETGLDNSTLFQPVDDTPYLFVNHARWDRSLVNFAASQIAKPSFRTEIVGRLHANRMAAMPILYHLVQGDQP